MVKVVTAETSEGKGRPSTCHHHPSVFFLNDMSNTGCFLPGILPTLLPTYLTVKGISNGM